MKISETRLKKIILEEIDSYLAELLCHDDKGHFSDCKKGATYSLSKKGAEAANVDKKFVGRGTVSSDGKKSDGTRKIRSKFGMNTSKKKAAGRIDIPDGDSITPKFSVSKYPEKYSEQKGQKYDPNWPSAQKRKRDDSIQKPNRKNWFHGYDEMSKLVRGVGLLGEEEFAARQFDGETILRAMEEALRDSELNLGMDESKLGAACKRAGFVTMGEATQRILKTLNAFSLAHDGKLNAPRDKQ